VVRIHDKYLFVYSLHWLNIAIIWVVPRHFQYTTGPLF
jgi:hypothetical protein